MFKVLIFSSLLLGVFCDLSTFENKEALELALEKSGALLEPPKEVYEKIVHDLEAIRRAYPVVVNVKNQPTFSNTKIICEKFTEESAKKLNASEFGPIVEHRMALDYYVLTFSKSYNMPVLIKTLAAKGLATGCSGDWIIGTSAHITIRADGSYTFYKGSGDCMSDCTNKQYWTFSVSEGKVTLEAYIHNEETGNGISTSL